MHVETKQLRKLSFAYLKGRLLTDEEVKIKYHMGGCDECYSRFCTELVMLKALTDNGLIDDKILEEDMEEKSFLKINLVKDKLKIVCNVIEEQLTGLWDFIYMPSVAFERGTNENNEEMVYNSRLSEYSCIKKADGMILIQLDEEYYPVGDLAVKYNKLEETVYKKFTYDEYSECFSVLIEESVLENGEIEIVEIREK